MKLSFKKDKKETGLRAVGNPYPNTAIKLDGKWMGMIYAPNWQTTDHKWKVSVMVNDDQSWHWVSFKARFDTEDAAREWVKANIEAIQEKFNLRLADR